MTPSRSKIARSRRGARRATVEDERSAAAWLDGEGATTARVCAMDLDREGACDGAGRGGSV